MFFTQDDYKKIQAWLTKNSVKDTEFNEAIMPFNGNETITFVQNGHNTKASLKDFVAQLLLLGVSDFLNITEKYNESYISLSQAIRLIPFRSRKIGQVITFLNEEGKWKLYQFQGTSILQWNEESIWVDIIQSVVIASNIVPDEEDVTGVTQGEATVIKFKDKTYNPNDYSGLGRVYLRKNIVTVKDHESGLEIKTNLLTQGMLDKEYTIYIIQYDYDLNGQTITVPEGCVLQFEGGSLSNGALSGININIDNNTESVIFKEITFSNNFTKYIKVNWFEYTDFSTILQLAVNISDEIYIPEGNYIMNSTVYIHTGTRIIGANSGEVDSTTIGTILTSNNELTALLATEPNVNNYNIVIENISFNGNKVVNRGVSLNPERTNNLGNIYINNCTFLGFKGIALYYKYGWISCINKCSFYDNNQAIYAQDATNSAKILNSTIARNNYGVVIAESNSVIISNSALEQNNSFGIALAMCRGAVISNNYFENCCREGYIYQDYIIKSDIILSNNPIITEEDYNSVINIINSNEKRASEGISIFDNWIIKDSDTNRSFIFFPGGRRVSIYNNTACDYSYAGLNSYTLNLIECILNSGYFGNIENLSVQNNIGFNEFFKCIDNKLTLFVKNKSVFNKSSDFYNNVNPDGSNIQFSGVNAGDFIKDYSVNNKLTLIYSNVKNYTNIDKTINTKNIIVPINRVPKSGILFINLSIKFNRRVVLYMNSITSALSSYENRIIYYDTPNEWMDTSIILKYEATLDTVNFNIRNVGDSENNLVGLQISNIFVGDPLEFNTENYIYQNSENTNVLAGNISSCYGNANVIHDGAQWRNEDGTLTSKVTII